MARAENPFGSSLLDKSTAKPGTVDMDIFSPKAKPVGQGVVSSDYQKRCDEEDPWPTDDASANGARQAVTLSNCRITTAPDKLATDQPFEMAVDLQVPAGSSAGPVTFRLLAGPANPDGGEDLADQAAAFQANIGSGIATASGTLLSPKTSVKPGTPLRYRVVAEHPQAKDKPQSPAVDVEAAKPPSPLAVWTLGAVHFGFDSSFILPAAAEKLAEFKIVIDQNPKAAVAIFGHADPVGEDDFNKGLAGRRAFSVYCLLTKNAQGWSQLSKGAQGDQWGTRTTQSILTQLRAPAGQPYYGGSVDGIAGPKTESAIKSFQTDSGLKPDGVAGPLTHAKLYAAYMAAINPVELKPEDFVGDPKDEKRQWACSGCGEFNPVLVFSKSDDAQFRASSDKTSRDQKNSPNRRATVILFPESAKGPGHVQFPCPAWSDGAAKCKEQFFEDAATRRNPSEAERTWEKDQNTFACKFYAGIAREKTESSDFRIHLLDEKRQRMGANPAAARLVEQVAGAPYRMKFADGQIFTGFADKDGVVREDDLPDFPDCIIQWGRQPDADQDDPPHDQDEADAYFIFTGELSLRPADGQEKILKILENLGHFGSEAEQRSAFSNFYQHSSDAVIESVHRTGKPA